jgi:hypothetical protein
MFMPNGVILKAAERSCEFLLLWVFQGEDLESDVAGNMRYYRILLLHVYT